jgi:hypothetical protein
MNWYGNRAQIIMVFIVTSFIILYFTSRNILATDESQALMYLVDSEPFGIPYYKWTESWWNWLLSIPKDSNPALDMDGKQCQRGMHYKYPVLFLVGSLNGTATRNCVIPSNVSLFFPATTSFCYNTDSLKRAEHILRGCASLQKSDINTNVMIDGSDLNTFAYDITNARVQSNLFGVNVPGDNILDISPQNISGIAAGDWVFLKPNALPPGTHEVSFTGNLNGTRSDVSYSLNMTEGTK